MVEGWEERREAADSVFLFPVVCWLSVMRPHLRPRRPAIGQGIRWLPREAWPGRAGPPRQAEARNAERRFQKESKSVWIISGESQSPPSPGFVSAEIPLDIKPFSLMMYVLFLFTSAGISSRLVIFHQSRCRIFHRTGICLGQTHSTWLSLHQITGEYNIVTTSSQKSEWRLID